ncbi:MAG: OmpA family protein [Pseudomonadota bacterium]
MTIMTTKTMRFGVLCLAGAALAACDTDAVRGIEPEGTAFQQALAMEYRDLAVFESDRMFDPIDAAYFAGRGLTAAQGQDVAPSDPARWAIGSATQEEAAGLRQRLVNAIASRGAGQPETAARAQVAYDCWLEQAEEDFQDDHIAACYDKFLANLVLLEGGAPAVAAAPAPVVAAAAAPATYICFSDFDSSVVDAECEAIVSLVADDIAANPNRSIELVGNTDTSGSAAYNMALSLRRSDNVATEMGVQGLPLTIISASGLGEENLRIPTGDGVRERENRRVEITLR